MFSIVFLDKILDSRWRILMVETRLECVIEAEPDSMRCDAIHSIWWINYQLLQLKWLKGIFWTNSLQLLDWLLLFSSFRIINKSQIDGSAENTT